MSNSPYLSIILIGEYKSSEIVFIPNDEDEPTLELGNSSKDSITKSSIVLPKTFISGSVNNDPFANVYSKKSVVLLSTRYIIQAIGRICRTNQKNRNVYIFADNRIAENIDFLQL